MHHKIASGTPRNQIRSRLFSLQYGVHISDHTPVVLPCHGVLNLPRPACAKLPFPSPIFRFKSEWRILLSLVRLHLATLLSPARSGALAYQKQGGDTQQPPGPIHPRPTTDGFYRAPSIVIGPSGRLKFKLGREQSTLFSLRLAHG